MFSTSSKTDHSELSIEDSKLLDNTAFFLKLYLGVSLQEQTECLQTNPLLNSFINKLKTFFAPDMVPLILRYLAMDTMEKSQYWEDQTQGKILLQSELDNLKKNPADNLDRIKAINSQFAGNDVYYGILKSAESLVITSIKNSEFEAIEAAIAKTKKAAYEIKLAAEIAEAERVIAEQAAAVEAERVAAEQAFAHQAKQPLDLEAVLFPLIRNSDQREFFSLLPFMYVDSDLLIHALRNLGNLDIVLVEEASKELYINKIEKILELRVPIIATNVLPDDLTPLVLDSTTTEDSITQAIKDKVLVFHQGNHFYAVFIFMNQNRIFIIEPLGHGPESDYVVDLMQRLTEYKKNKNPKLEICCNGFGNALQRDNKSCARMIFAAVSCLIFFPSYIQKKMLTMWFSMF